MRKHVIYADLDTIVFEGRAKDYGAYQMRRQYNRYLGRSALIAFLLFIAVTGMPKVIDWISPELPPKPDLKTKMVPVDHFDPPPIREEKTPEEPPLPPETRIKEPPPAARATIEFRTVQPAPDDEADDDATIRDMNELTELDTALIGNQDAVGLGDDGTGEPDWNSLTGDGDGEPEILKQEHIPSDTEFVLVEEMPRPVNMDQLKDLIGYPSQAVEAGIEGKVIVRVLVDEMGRYRQHKILKNPHTILTKAVEKQLPQLVFTPGIQAAKPIKVWVNIPFEFILNRP